MRRILQFGSLDLIFGKHVPAELPMATKKVVSESPRHEAGSHDWNRTGTSRTARPSHRRCRNINRTEHHHSERVNRGSIPTMVLLQVIQAIYSHL
jgi:hypothetical protein